MAAPKPTPAKVAEVTPEVTKPLAEPSPISGIAPRPLFTTTTEDAALVIPEQLKRPLNPKTLAERAAGKEAISQYVSAE